jgi:putative transcriptional regulator
MLYNRVKEVRKERGMSVAELARRSKTSRQTIYKIEDKNAVPNGLSMLLICEALGKEPKEIFFTKTVTHVKQDEKSA